MLKQSLTCLQQRHDAIKGDPKQQATAQFIATYIQRLKSSLKGPGRAQILQKCQASLARDGWKATPACLSCLKSQGCVRHSQLKQACNQICKGGAAGPGAKPAIVPANMNDTDGAKKKVNP